MESGVGWKWGKGEVGEEGGGGEVVGRWWGGGGEVVGVVGGSGRWREEVGNGGGRRYDEGEVGRDGVGEGGRRWGLGGMKGGRGDWEEVGDRK